MRASYRQERVIFPRPLPLDLVKYLFLVLAYRKGNMLLGDGKNKIIGFRCSKIDFTDLTKNTKIRNQF